MFVDTYFSRYYGHPCDFNKLKALAKTLPNLYGSVGPVACPDFGQDIIKECCDSLHNINITAHDKNSIYLGLMLASEREGLSRQGKGLLEFLLLQSIRYTGMNTIALSDQVVSAFHCPLYVLAELTSTTTTIKSWAAYRHVVETYLVNEDQIGNVANKDELLAKARDPYWSFSREFESGVFHELSFVKNRTLRTLLAIVLDFANKPGAHVHDQGPVVSGFGSIRNIQPSEDDYDLGYVIEQYLRENFLTAPVGNLAKSMRAKANDRKAQRQGLEIPPLNLEQMDDILGDIE